MVGVGQGATGPLAHTRKPAIIGRCQDSLQSAGARGGPWGPAMGPSHGAQPWGPIGLIGHCGMQPWCIASNAAGELVMD